MRLLADSDIYRYRRNSECHGVSKVGRIELETQIREKNR